MLFADEFLPLGVDGVVLLIVGGVVESVHEEVVEVFEGFTALAHFLFDCLQQVLVILGLGEFHLSDEVEVFKKRFLASQNVLDF